MPATAGRRKDKTEAVANEEKNAEGATMECSDMAAIMTELKALRKDVNQSLERIEGSVLEVKEAVKALEKRQDGSEQRISDIEDRCERNERLLAYSFRKGRQLKCEDLENRSRRSNIRIYGVKEGAETNGNLIQFTATLLRNILQLPDDLEPDIERAHRSLAFKPIDPTAPPRSIVVKFLHFQIKQKVFKAWGEKDLKFDGSRISLDHDYSAGVVRRRKEYADIKPQLKDRGVKFKSPYPGRLKVFLDSGERTFASAWEHLGMSTKLSEAELMEKHLHGLGWLTQRAPGERHSRSLIKDLEALKNPKT